MGLQHLEVGLQVITLVPHLPGHYKSIYKYVIGAHLVDDATRQIQAQHSVLLLS